MKWRRSSNNPERKTYALCPRVDVDDQLRIDDGTPQGTFWVFMMGEEEPGYFPVSVVTVDLGQGEKQGKDHEDVMDVQCKQSGRSFLGW